MMGEWQDLGESDHDIIIELGNEFAEVQVRKVQTRNGSRLLISSPKSGHYITLCPLELEALTWQDQNSMSRLITNPYGPMESDGDSE